MSAARPRGPIVIDTDVFSAELVSGSPLADRYAPIVVGQFVSPFRAPAGAASAQRRPLDRRNALRLRVPLVSNHAIFRDIPGLTLESIRGG